MALVMGTTNFFFLQGMRGFPGEKGELGPIGEPGMIVRNPELYNQ